jgi:hypothetical protein
MPRLFPMSHPFLAQKLPRFLSAETSPSERTDDGNDPLLIVHTEKPRCILAFITTENEEGQVTMIESIPHTWLDPKPHDSDEIETLCRKATAWQYAFIQHSAKAFDDQAE